MGRGTISKSIQSSFVNRRSFIKFGVAAASALTIKPSFAAMRIMPDRSLHLTNPHTGESFQDVYWSKGHYLRPSFKRINWLMRDYHVGEVQEVDPALMDLLHVLASRVETKRPFEILSGYRTPETNERLRDEGYGAAPNSMHLIARAVDIHAAGVKLSHLYRAALSLRRGGVGYYPHSNFIHVDTGPVRHW